MTIPALTTANTFQEWINDTQQLIALMNSLTDGPIVISNGKLVIATANVANLNLVGSSILGLNTSSVSEGSNLYFTIARVRSNVSNTGVAILYDSTNGVFSHAVSGVANGTYGNTKYVAVVTIDDRGHTTSVANVAIDYNPAKLVLNNTSPILYDSVNGTFSHANSSVTIGTYGDAANIPVLTVGQHGHIQSATVIAPRLSSTTQTGVVQLNDTLTSTSNTVAATANVVNSIFSYAQVVANNASAASANANINIVLKNFTYISGRKGLNFIQGPNAIIQITDDAANNQANISIDTIFGGGINPQGWVSQKANGVLIAANSNTIAFLDGPGTQVRGNYSAPGAGEVQFTVYANNIYDQANSAALAANTTFTAAKVRANVSNTTPITYDQTNGIFGHANSTVVAGTYGDSITIPVFAVGQHGHLNSVTNTVIRTATTGQTGVVLLDDSVNRPTSANAATSLAVNTVFQNSQAQFANTWLALTRQVQQNVNDFIEVGNFVSPNGSHNFMLSAVVSWVGMSVSKTYMVSVANNLAGQGSWLSMTPLTSTGAYNGSDDFSIDMNVTSQTTYLRLRKTAGANVGLADIRLYPMGPHLATTSLDIFTPTSATGNTPTVAGVTAPWWANSNNQVTGQLSDARLYNAANNTGQFGDSNTVVTVTIDSKGRVTNLTTNTINHVLARQQISNTAPINYDPASGIISHALSTAVANGYGDSINVPGLAIDNKGHITSISNVAIRVGTTGQTGILQLNDTITSTSVSLAATANSVNTVNNLVRTMQSGLGTMSSQSASAVNITGGSASSVVVDATRVTEQLNTFTPGSGAGVTVDWAKGASKITTSGTNAITFSNIPAGSAGHIIEVNSFNNVTWPGSVVWGVSGIPSIAGKAVVSLVTIDSGTTVYASIIWRAV